MKAGSGVGVAENLIIHPELIALLLNVYPRGVPPLQTFTNIHVTSQYYIAFKQKSLLSGQWTVDLGYLSRIAPILDRIRHLYM